jgi:hypothetical protein
MDPEMRPMHHLRTKGAALATRFAPPHPRLSKHLSMNCKHCGHKTTSAEFIARCLLKEHGMKPDTSLWSREHGVIGPVLQC